MPLTPVFDLPFPDPGTSDDVPVDIHALAARLDMVLPTSGVYEPDYGPGNINGDQVAASSPLPWGRIGDIVTVTGLIEAVMPYASGLVELKVTLPHASNLGADNDLSGVAVLETASGHIPGTIVADTVNNRAAIRYYTPDDSPRPVRIHFAYRVL